MDAWHVQHRRLRHSLLAFLMVVAGGLCSGKATAADCAGTLTPLSACPKSADNNVEIGAAGCQHVVVDKSLAFSKITVDPSGELCVRDRDLTGQTLLLSADQIIVRGTLQIGSKESPIGGSNPANHVRITFTGKAPEIDDSQAPLKMQQPCPTPISRRGCNCARTACCGCSALGVRPPRVPNGATSRARLAGPISASRRETLANSIAHRA